jgi:UDP-perosamine 4-acetyltransferase
MDKTIYILGVGRNTIVTIDLAEACGFVVGGLYHYLDDRTGELLFGHRILGSNSELFASDISGKYFAVSMGDNDIRADLYQKILQRGGIVPTMIHPTASVSKYATVKSGVMILPNSVVDPDTVIDENTIISAKSSVLHNCRVGKHCFLAPDAVLGANTVVDDYAMIGLNATVLSNKAAHIGRHSIEAAGAVVTKPVAPETTVAGIPAKPL